MFGLAHVANQDFGRQDEENRIQKSGSGQAQVVRERSQERRRKDDRESRAAREVLARVKLGMTTQ